MVLYLFTKFEEPVKVFSIGHFFVYEYKPGLRALYRIKNVDYLHYVVSDTLNANDKTGDITPSELIPEDETIMYTFLIGVKGPVKVYLKQPLQIARWGVGAIPGYITQETSPFSCPNPATFTVTMRDTRFAYNVENPLSEQVSYKIRFMGYKYEIEKLADEIRWTKDGRLVYVKAVDYFPSEVIKEVLEAWKRGRIPELTTKGIVSRR